jgi:hypothetical protein
MILTEEEAKTKWCPFARSFDVPENDESDAIAITAGTNRVRSGRPDKWCLCIASQCMAWTWLGGTAGPRLRGYCGLAKQNGYPR